MNYLRCLPLALLALLPLLVCGAAHADTVVMKTLETLDGKVLSTNDDFVELQVEFGTMRVPLEKILRIEADTPELKAAREATLAQEREFAAKMLAEGKVPYKGKWVTPEEKAADEARLAALKKQKEEEKKKKEAELAAKKAQELKQRQQALAAALAQQKAADALALQQSKAERQRLQNSPYRDQIGNMNSGQMQSVLKQNGF